MAILYEIEKSGFADSLRSGIVVTGGVAQTANLANLISDISGFKVRTGYPKKTFSCEGCDGLAETSAATAIGLIMSSIHDQTINCVTSNEETLPKDETIIEISQPGDEQEPQGMLFKDEEIEKVEPAAPKPKPIRKDKKAPGLFTRYLNRMTTKIDNIFDILDEDKAQPEIDDNDEEETEEKA